MKAKAAIARCQAASTETTQWHYLYIPQGVFEGMAGDTIAELARAPALQNLLQAEEFQGLPLFVKLGQSDEQVATEDYYRKLAQNLKRTLVFNNGLSLIGLMRTCLDYALNDSTKIDGVFEALQTQLRFEVGRKVLETVARINDFRNTYIAHQEQELTDKNLAEQELKIWVEALHRIGK